MPSQWMADAKLRALWHRLGVDLTLDDIAEINYQEMGWRPDRSTMSKKYLRMGMPPIRHSSQDLVPWKVKPEHNQNRLRYMLQAESRARAGKELSETDRKLIPELNNLLWPGRGKLMVVGYHEQVGFHLLERTDEDADIIRAPKEAGQIRPDIETAIRTLKDEELAEYATREGLHPLLLENLGREDAAHILWSRMGKLDADLNLLPENDADVTPPLPVTRRRRRRAG